MDFDNECFYISYYIHNSHHLLDYKYKRWCFTRAEFKHQQNNSKIEIKEKKETTENLLISSFNKLNVSNNETHIDRKKKKNVFIIMTPFNQIHTIYLKIIYKIKKRSSQQKRRFLESIRSPSRKGTKLRDFEILEILESKNGINKIGAKNIKSNFEKHFDQKHKKSVEKKLEDEIKITKIAKDFVGDLAADKKFVSAMKGVEKFDL